VQNEKASMSLPDSAHAAAMAWQNECVGWQTLGQVQENSPVFRIETHPGLTCAWWQGSPLQMDHYFLAHPQGWTDPEAVLSRIKPASQPASTGSTQTVLRFLNIPDQQDWHQAAVVNGFRMFDSSPLMAADLDDLSNLPPLPEQVQVFKVETSAQYQQALEIIHEVFGGPRALCEFFNPLEAVQVFLAFYQGQPAASTTLWPYAGTAGIYSVATRPRFRRRGLAMAVVGQALKYAHQAGFHLACLRTSPNLFPLYQRLGFEPVGQVLRYIRS
jgi:GNAT superfamily N-acetyltransferase